MAYTALARKYRSRTFHEVIGQDPIATTLANAIQAGRIHHGYLFTGTRGVGKTSMARILAKALNCLEADGPTATPCCKCDACVNIAEGHDVDVIEIDAASNTGVDNIRDLRSNAVYRPARARFKVYIIDEVHMLSTGAFNALLKTLEEPPEHVKFILATTEFQKVPPTIRSRCQCFSFRNIGPDPIARRLTEIAAEEGAEAEDAAVQRIARLANGSMRDALSILDQLLSVSSTSVTSAVLDEIVPPAQDERVFALLEHVAAGDAHAVLTALDRILSAGRGLELFCTDAVEVLRALMMVRTCGPDATLVDIPAGARDDYARLSEQFELSHLVQMIPMFEELRRNVRYSTAGRALAEALLVRLAHLREWTPIEQLIRQLPNTAGSAGEKKKCPRPATPLATPAAATAAPEPPAPRRPTPPPAPANNTPANHQSGATALAEPPPAVDAPEPASQPVDVPADYVPEEAPTASPPARELVRRDLSQAQRTRVERDPLVRQALDLFDGVVIDIKEPTTESAADTVE